MTIDFGALEFPPGPYNIDKKITVLCSSPKHPIYPIVEEWCKTKGAALLTDTGAVSDGDLLFMISFTQIVKPDVLSRFKHALVVHASDLPRGRGWSPHIWHILNGEEWITVTLLEAAEKVDSGKIWAQNIFAIEPHELYDEINSKLFTATIRLMDWAIDHIETVKPREQAADPATYFKQRTPADSEIDPNKTIAEQFDLLRVCDPNRFPAFFNHRGHKYKVRLEKD